MSPYEAFAPKMAEDLDVVLGEEESESIQQVLIDLFDERTREEIPVSNADLAEVSRMMFTAGRVYQTQFSEDDVVVNVPMNSVMITSFVEYLVRGQ